MSEAPAPPGAEPPGPLEPLDELGVLAEATALAASGYLDGVTSVARGDAPATALPVLLLAVSEVSVAGARLGALADVEAAPAAPAATSASEDVSALRGALAAVLAGVDDYADVRDPLTSADVVAGRLSDDLAEVAAALVPGLRAHAEGRGDEALAVWQASYLAGWGARAASALRVLQSLLAHVRQQP